MRYRKYIKVNGDVIKLLSGPVEEDVITGRRGSQIRVFRHSFADEEEEDEW